MDYKRRFVDIHPDRCIGCTRCMRVCPTEAIRIVNKKVFLLEDRCIYCGNCITACHKSAYKISGDSFAVLNKYKINIAILPLSIYGMVANNSDLGAIYETLYNFGFDEVFDLSIVTHLLAEKVDYILDIETTQPFILTQCPSIIRLVQLKYPTLMNNLLPFDFPFEIGARIAKKMYQEKYKLPLSDIGIHYISECLSNFIAIKEPLGKRKSEINNVFLLNDLFINKNENSELICQVSKKGIQYATVGAIEKTTGIKEYISVDGINNVCEILDKIYLDAFKGVKLIEAYSCVGGCVGGNFTLENTFLSKWKIHHFSEQLGTPDDYLKQFGKYIDDDIWYFKEIINGLDPYKLSENIKQSLYKMSKINEILKQLPNIDCCACGSPSCRALAEDIVNNRKKLSDCLVKRGEANESQ